MAHWDVRILEAPGDCSQWMEVSQRGSPMCVWATDFARAYISAISEKAHFEVSECRCASCVPYVGCYGEGERGTSAAAFPRGLASLINAMIATKLEVCDKALNLATSRGMARKIATRLHELSGIDVAVAGHAQDLGADMSLSRMRSTDLPSTRLAKFR